MNNITVANFMRLLLKDVVFSEYIINNYNEIEADIRSYRLDATCSCRHKIEKYFELNKDKFLSSINEWERRYPDSLKSELENVEFDSEDIKKVLKPTLPPSEWSKYKDVIGDIVEIAPDPNEYKRIISVARQEWLYNGINILETVKFDPQTKKESVVWLLLFY
jgi:hypothetical protein